MTRPVAVLCLSILAVLTTAGCGGGQSSGDSAERVQASASAGAKSGGSLPSGLDDGPRAGESPVDEEKADVGEKLFQDKGCSACHAFGKRVTGPDLAGVSMRRTAKWMEQQILHPDVMTKQDPIARQLFTQFSLQMPNQKLTADEARAVIEFFKYHDHEAGEHAAGKEGGR